MNITSEHVGAVTIPTGIVVALALLFVGLTKSCEVVNEPASITAEMEGKATLLRIERGWVERVNPLTGKTEWHAMTNLPTVTIEQK